MLVEGDELAEDGRGQLGGEDGGGGVVAAEGAVRDLFLGHALRADLLGRLAEGEGLGLGEEVGHQQVVLGRQFLAQFADGAGEADEVGRDELGALVDQLVVGVLAVGARGAPDDRAGLPLHRVAVALDRLAVGLHVELLEVGGELRQVVRVRQHRVGLGVEEVVVPDAQQAQE